MDRCRLALDSVGVSPLGEVGCSLPTLGEPDYLYNSTR